MTLLPRMKRCKGSFLLNPTTTPPPPVEVQNLTPPLPPPPPPTEKQASASPIGLNSLARDLKHYAAYYFAYTLWWVGGINRKDPLQILGGN